MHVTTKKLEIKTQADGGMHDLTESISHVLKQTKLSEGTVTVFCTGSTYSLSTVEFEPGLRQDIPDCFERIAPRNIDYAHHQTWHDDNGRSHVKATLMGPSLVIPFVEGKLTLGTWQQVALFEWDTRPRERVVVLQFIGNSSNNVH